MMPRYSLSLLLLNLMSGLTATGQLVDSYLPIIHIQTNGNTIVDEPKVFVDIGIISNMVGLNNINDPWNHYNGHCWIELRGNSTLEADKKF